MNAIIKEIKRLRQEKGLSQAALGAKLGLPQSHISKIEKGETDLRLSTLIELAQILGLELVLVPRLMAPMVHSLIKGEDPSQKPRWQLDEDVRE